MSRPRELKIVVEVANSANEAARPGIPQTVEKPSRKAKF